MVLGQEIAHRVQQLVEHLKPRQVAVGRRHMFYEAPLDQGPPNPHPRAPYPTPEDTEAAVGTSP